MPPLNYDSSFSTLTNWVWGEWEILLLSWFLAVYFNDVWFLNIGNILTFVWLGDCFNVNFLTPCVPKYYTYINRMTIGQPALSIAMLVSRVLPPTTTLTFYRLCMQFPEEGNLRAKAACFCCEVLVHFWVTFLCNIENLFSKLYMLDQARRFFFFASVCSKWSTTPFYDFHPLKSS